MPLKASGECIGVLTFVTAESGREYGPDELKAAEDLASRAAIAVQNARLLATLKDADRSKDEFLAMLAHELRNPLAPLSNSLRILRIHGAPGPEARWARDVIDHQVQQLTRLVDDLLDVSRIRTGRIELRRERVALARVIGSAVESCQPFIERRRHQLTVRLPETPLFMDADFTRLTQVFLNLLHNAAKYTPPGGRLGVSASVQDGQVCVQVTDNGIGIPPEMLGRIFEIFTQVDRTLERTEGGLGIGLTLVQRLVEMHGGSVVAHSTGASHGSEFVVRLPLSAAASTDEPGGAAPAPLPASAPTRHQRVLVVDDNCDAAESLAVLLRMTGHEARTTHDGLTALALAESFRPTAIVLDIGLPGLNGYEVARKMRQQLGAGVLLIALTGWGQAQDRQRSRQAGFDHHLTKPVELTMLERLLATPAGGARPARTG